MKKIPARIVVRHTFGGHKDIVVPEKDGCLGSWNGGNFELEIVPLKGADIIKTDKDFHISYPHSVEQGRDRLFKIQIPLLQSEKANAFVTKFPSNHVKLISISENPWEFNLYEIAIFAQPKPGTESEINFFLTTQLCYSSTMFRNEKNEVVMPGYEGFSRWEDLQFYVGLNVAKDKLPVLSPSTSGGGLMLSLKEHEGIVVWYNLAQGVGMIQTTKTNARVNWRDIQTKERFRYLKAGQKVSFTELVLSRNTYRRPRVTKFQLDAEGVKPHSIRSS